MNQPVYKAGYKGNAMEFGAKGKVTYKGNATHF